MEKRHALVTGGSRGIGRAIALKLAREGCAVTVNFVSNAEAAAAVVREIEAAGGEARACRAAVEDPASVAAMARDIGPVDILVNNAAVLHRGDLDDFAGDLETMRRVNVDGVVNTTRAFSPAMRERGHGRIVNIVSIAALGTAMAGTTFYAATKDAVVALTRRFALTLGPHGITVNAVAPGFILTDMVTRDRTTEEVEAVVRSIGARAMMGRVGTPEDVAHAVAFLASERSGFITAQVLTVDGGRMDFIGHP